MYSFINTIEKCEQNIRSIKSEIAWQIENGIDTTAKRESLAYWESELAKAQQALAPEAIAKKNAKYAQSAQGIREFVKSNPNLPSHIKKSMLAAAKALG